MNVEPDAIEVEYTYYHYNTGYGNNGERTESKRFSVEEGAAALSLFRQLTDYAHGRLTQDEQNALDDRLFGGDGVLHKGRDFPVLRWVSEPITAEHVERHCLTSKIRGFKSEPEPFSLKAL
jgi:hypothetical protein